jgi:hypothetical protein
MKENTKVASVKKERNDGVVESLAGILLQYTLASDTHEWNMVYNTFVVF